MRKKAKQLCKYLYIKWIVKYLIQNARKKCIKSIKSIKFRHFGKYAYCFLVESMKRLTPLCK